MGAEQRDPWMERITEGTGVRPVGVSGFKLSVLESGTATFDSKGESCSIGSHPSNQLQINDPTVSRFHCEISATPEGALIKDLRSLNGTYVDGVRIREAFLRDGSVLRLGNAAVRCEISRTKHLPPLSQRTELGRLVGASLPMRVTFARLERAAAAETNILIEGEAGTGKGAAAEVIHLNSARRSGPFRVVDCSALPPAQLDSEIFGHEAGAFPGAESSRAGAVETASRGTLLLDEIGDLPADLQPKVLRLIEEGQIRRIGSSTLVPVDVRVIASTNRDLRAEVNTARFRPDLYYRIAGMTIPLPALREHPDDLPLIARRILESLGASSGDLQRLLAPESMSRLQRAVWPGNVRELRDYLERCLAHPSGADTLGGMTIDATMPYAESRDRAIAAFERTYVQQLLALHRGHVSAAAKSANITRVHLHRLIRRHGVSR